MRLFRHQLRSEQRIFWRSREAAVFIFIFPLLLFLLLGSVYNGEIDGYPAADVLLAGLLGYGAANTAFAGIAIALVLRRENAVLKRIRATPLPAATYMAALLTSTLIVFALQTLAMFTIGRTLFDTSLPDRLGSLAAVLVLGAASFAAIGVATAALIRSAEGSSAVVNLILLPMAFLSGAFGPTRDYPEFLQAIADVLPLKYFIDLVRAVYLKSDRAWSDPTAIAVVVAWGLLGFAVAARRFTWEPRER